MIKAATEDELISSVYQAVKKKKKQPIQKRKPMCKETQVLARGVGGGTKHHNVPVFF